jgi:2-methylcitrate dehydratase PrpD
MGITEQLARFLVETKYDNIPEEAVLRAKDIMLDTLGVIIAGSREEAAKTMISFIDTLGGKPAAGVINGGYLTSAPHAALANGTSAHVLDYDDSGMGQGHSGVVILPAVLAVAEENGNSGKEVLAAYILGTEIMGRMGNGLPELHIKGWHPTSVFGAMGAAAAAAKLLNLNADQTAMALGLVGSQAGGLLHNFGTFTKPFHAGHAARSGVMSAMMIKHGFTASKDILDGNNNLHSVFYGKKFDLTSYIGKLGAPFCLVSPGTHVKKYPTCYGNHRSLDAMLHLVNEYDIKPEDVESVDCQGIPLYLTLLFYTNPTTGLQAKFSMQFNMAAAIAYRAVGLAQVTDEGVNNPVVRDLMQRVTLRANPAWQEGESKWELHPDIVTVKLKNGKEYSHEVVRARGHAEVPLTWDELLAKYRDCASLVLEEKNVERSADIIANLEKMKDIKELMAIVTAK